MSNFHLMMFFPLLLILPALLLVVMGIVWAKRFQSQLTSHNNRLAQLETTLKEGIAQQRDEIEALINEKVEQKSEENRETQQNEISLLNEKIAETETTGIERIEAYTSQVEDQLKALRDNFAPKSDIDALSDRCHVAEEKVAKLDESISDLAASINESQQHIEEVIAKLRNEILSQIEDTIGGSEKFHDQLKSVVGDDLKSAFRTIDDTLTSVLGEIKSELTRGINWIDNIQNICQTEKKENE